MPVLTSSKTRPSRAKTDMASHAARKSTSRASKTARVLRNGAFLGATVHGAGRLPALRSASAERSFVDVDMTSGSGGAKGLVLYFLLGLEVKWRCEAL